MGILSYRNSLIGSRTSWSNRANIGRFDRPMNPGQPNDNRSAAILAANIAGKMPALRWSVPDDQLSDARCQLSAPIS